MSGTNEAPMEGFPAVGQYELVEPLTAEEEAVLEEAILAQQEDGIGPEDEEEDDEEENEDEPADEAEE